MHRKHLRCRLKVPLAFPRTQCTHSRRSVLALPLICFVIALAIIVAGYWLLSTKQDEPARATAARLVFWAFLSVNALAAPHSRATRACTSSTGGTSMHTGSTRSAATGRSESCPQHPVSCTINRTATAAPTTRETIVEIQTCLLTPTHPKRRRLRIAGLK